MAERGNLASTLPNIALKNLFVAKITRKCNTVCLLCTKHCIRLRLMLSWEKFKTLPIIIGPNNLLYKKNILVRNLELEDYLVGRMSENVIYPCQMCFLAYKVEQPCLGGIIYLHIRSNFFSRALNLRAGNTLKFGGTPWYNLCFLFRYDAPLSLYFPGWPIPSYLAFRYWLIIPVI